jgi:hypothetical protein
MSPVNLNFCLKSWSENESVMSTDKGTYLTVPTQNAFKSILTDRDLDAYLKYEYLSCSHSGLENK